MSLVRLMLNRKLSLCLYAPLFQIQMLSINSLIDLV
ncbi:hypothetical protein XF_2626 [Xylella fastidiosa 9a5c]|uniref:Uncharacterized protein n=1 Tax=Xylella fastidiosa (strain 9a5c) TaxID=160492 RepID=Q9PA92_XYLFA|nr:hypothetical protein XF_2626 [Xylella fastidiosa 9a5c]